MTTTTSNLGLFKYNTSTDGSLAFNINTALNDNWDKLDTNFGTLNTNAVKRLSTSAATGNSSTPVYVDSTGQVRTCSYSIPTSSGLTATTSLAENGYIKFSNDFIIQWGKKSTDTSGTNIEIVMNITMNSTDYHVSCWLQDTTTSSGQAYTRYGTYSITSKTKFIAGSYNNHIISWLAVG